MRSNRSIRYYCAHLVIAQGLLLLFLCISFLAGCKGPKMLPPPPPPPSPTTYEIDGKIYHPLDAAHGFVENGIASWYGDDFHGKKTANCETYNMYAMTAAHKTLPLGTVVEVHNLENDKKAVVRINDRGPYVNNRIIDLSYKVASDLGIVRNGTAKVQIVALGTDDMLLNKANSDMFFTGDFTIQTGAFSQKTNAEKMKQMLAPYVDKVDITPIDKNGITFYRVRAGQFTSLKKAQCIEQQLVEKGFPEAFVVARDL
jgi:rare lipoprotein A